MTRPTTLRTENLQTPYLSNTSRYLLSSFSDLCLETFPGGRHWEGGSEEASGFAQKLAWELKDQVWDALLPDTNLQGWKPIQQRVWRPAA